MSLDSNSFPNNFEKLKRDFAKKKEAIEHYPATVGTIGTFADAALNELVTLIDRVKKSYVRPGETRIGKELEDAAFAHFELKGISDLLSGISETQERVKKAGHLASTHPLQLSLLITPPDHRPAPVVPGSGAGIERTIAARLQTLVYILLTDFELAENDFHITMGLVSEEHWRKEPYYRIEVPSLGKVVYLCDEVGNASYIFDSKRLTTHNITLPELDLMTKPEKNALIQSFPGTGVRREIHKSWRTVISADLASDSLGATSLLIHQKSEFVRPLLLENYDQFEREVREKWGDRKDEGSHDISKWYKENRKPNWPSAPHDYKLFEGKWKGFPALVGVEVVPLLEDYDTFALEVNDAWRQRQEESGDDQGLYEWYQKNRKPHWPGSPSLHKPFKERWKGLRTLLGIQPLLEDYNQFEREVREALEQNPLGDNQTITAWYKENRKPTWPSTPSHYKLFEGKWKGFPALVGVKIIPLIKDYNQFEREVQEAWTNKPEGGSQQMHEWYQKNRKPHWPSTPEKHNPFKEKWKGWRELIGREPFLDDYIQFQREVLEIWNKREDKEYQYVSKWYSRNRKPNWPSAPERHKPFRGEWKGWPALVGK